VADNRILAFVKHSATKPKCKAAMRRGKGDANEDDCTGCKRSLAQQSREHC
jgi:hypothetical protein